MCHILATDILQLHVRYMQWLMSEGSHEYIHMVLTLSKISNTYRKHVIVLAPCVGNISLIDICGICVVPHV